MTQASEKQVKFIEKLMSEKEVTGPDTILITAVKTLLATNPETLTKAAASKAINALMAMPSLNAKPKAAPPAAGYYVYKNEVYKVQVSPSTGNSYAKVFTQEGGWLYAQGMVNKMHDAQALTLEKAKEFGHLYGSCIICGRTLTDEASIDAGIGPVCAGKL